MAKAVILVSGGIDSTTCLAIAKSEGYGCYALSFDYGQRHQVELESAKKVVAQMGALSHKIIEMDLRSVGGSSLTDQAIDVPEWAPDSDAIPTTYVPARNTLFLSVALGWAEVLSAEAIFIGVNALDYSGYPDCRPEYIAAFQTMADLATKQGVEAMDKGEKSPIAIKTPLIDINKRDIVLLGDKLGVDYSLTVSCYQATPEGLACGTCDSCHFRRQGFIEAGIVDPTRYQT